MTPKEHTNVEKREYITICSEKQCKFTFRIEGGETMRIGRKKSGLVFVVDEEGFSWVESGGKRFIAEIVERNQNKYHLLINGNSYFFTVESPFSFKRRKFLTSLKKVTKHVRVVAPMPGKIVALMVNEGDSVSTGDPLLILEAMKMQNEILSEVAGTVTKIAVKPGQNVMKEELMIELTK
jgi:glutaconyl-CoA/methylmalonyl-CoA decarboxylase subunit gamma